jgi:dephospho-CoA kinase
MITIGLTGGIGSGKTTVAKILESKGFPVFYSDDVAKAIVVGNPTVKDEIIELLGEEAYLNGAYNREFVGKTVFANKELLTKLNHIIHPAVRKAFSDFSRQQTHPLVINEAAILFETGAYTSFDKTILVCSPKELRIKRLLNRDGASEGEIKARMDKQWTDEQKRELANFVIENDEKHSLLFQIDEIVRELVSSSR